VCVCEREGERERERERERGVVQMCMPMVLGSIDDWGDRSAKHWSVMHSSPLQPKKTVQVNQV